MTIRGIRIPFHNTPVEGLTSHGIVVGQPSFHDIRVRIDEATRELDRLRADVERFRLSPMETRTAHGDEGLRHDAAVRAVPTELSVRAGLVLYLLRSVLEHVAAQATLKAASPGTVDEALRASAFPICSTSIRFTKFKKRSKEAFRTWHPQVRKLMELRQPFTEKGPADVDDHCLMILDDLGYADRHRHLLTLGTQFRDAYYEVRADRDVGGAFEFGIQFPGTAPGSQGSSYFNAPDAPVGTQLVGGLIGHADVVLYRYGTKRDYPVIDGLEALSAHVVKLVDEFEPLIVNG